MKNCIFYLALCATSSLVIASDNKLEVAVMSKAELQVLPQHTLNMLLKKAVEEDNLNTIRSLLEAKANPASLKEFQQCETPEGSFAAQQMLQAALVNTPEFWPLFDSCSK